MSHTASFKSLLTNALFLTATLTGTIAFAQTTQSPAPLTVGVYPTKQVDKFCLAVEKQPNAFVFVQLMAPGGQELYRATLPQKGDKFRQIFDLNELQDGTYTLRIKQGGNVIVKSIQLRKTPERIQPTRSLSVGQ